MRLGKHRRNTRMGLLAKVNKKILKYRSITKSGRYSRPLADYPTSPIDTLSLIEHIRMIPTLIRNAYYVENSLRISKDEPIRTSISDQELYDLKSFAQTLGIAELGFTTIASDDIFSGFGVLYTNAIVFTFPMNKADILSEPCFDKLMMIESTYADSGMMASKLTKFLRDRGFGAQAGPGAGGLTIYPVLAEKAGLGVFGRHGILITKALGPGTRLGLVYTNIENLPNTAHNNDDMAWVKEFCSDCGLCIRKCPHHAIYETPEKTKRVYFKHIDTEKCVKQFESKYGCTVCLKVCVFTTAGYDRVQKASARKRNRKNKNRT